MIFALPNFDNEFNLMSKQKSPDKRQGFLCIGDALLAIYELLFNDILMNK